MKSPDRILFIGEAVTMAHVARPLTLATGLVRAGWSASSIFFACDPSAHWILDPSPVTALSLPSQPAAAFLEALEKEKPLYSAETLAAYVEEDRKLLRAIKPDLVVGDFRLSLSISARLEQVSYVAISNFHWSPYSLEPFPHTFDGIESTLGTTLAQSIFAVVFPIGSFIHSRPMNATRERFGIKGPSFDLRKTYTDADFVLYEDIPDWLPSRPLPSTHHFIGPIVFTPPSRYPDWWETWSQDKPIVYVTLGSSGDTRILDSAIPALGQLDATVLFATAGRGRERGYPPNFYVAEFLPGPEAAKKADLVISNGGSGTTKQALLAGKPVLSLITNMDQQLSAIPVSKRGAGIYLKRSKISLTSVREAAQRLLSEPAFRAHAARIAEELKRWDSGREFQNFLAGLNK